jgi:hypothetical protein
MPHDNPLTLAEEKALATAVLLGGHGAGFTAKPEDAGVCDSLVERDYLARVEGVEDGYVLTPSFAAAIGLTVARKAAEAANN